MILLLSEIIGLLIVLYW